MKYYDSMGFESPDGIWARRADVVDIEYSIKLQRLIENLKYDTDTPYPELHHHKMIVAAKARIHELEAALHEIRDADCRGEVCKGIACVALNVAYPIETAKEYNNDPI